mmetsp:Transcript_17330/g.35810  ORF Transcript_17330/g.35810 Transcript_17330/m.35810 type:complete len:278 (-) Transcript_17330:202-1035(-)
MQPRHLRFLHPQHLSQFRKHLFREPAGRTFAGPAIHRSFWATATRRAAEPARNRRGGPLVLPVAVHRGLPRAPPGVFQHLGLCVRWIVRLRLLVRGEAGIGSFQGAGLVRHHQRSAHSPIAGNNVHPDRCRHRLCRCPAGFLHAGTPRGGAGLFLRCPPGGCQLPDLVRRHHERRHHGICVLCRISEPAPKPPPRSGTLPVLDRGLEEGPPRGMWLLRSEKRMAHKQDTAECNRANGKQQNERKATERTSERKATERTNKRTKTPNNQNNFHTSISI